MPKPQDLIGRYVQFDYPDGTGGAGLVEEISYTGQGWEAVVDYGYSFLITDDVKITVKGEDGC